MRLPSVSVIPSEFSNAFIQALRDALQRVSKSVNLTAYSRHTVVSGNYIVPFDVSFVLVNKTVGAATQVTLYKATQEGQQVTVKDGKGDANTNNITVVGTGQNIDGAASFVINANRASYTFLWTGAEWSAI